MPKVIVGMSGGVDSSVTAYLLREQGYEVEGISFIMWDASRSTGGKVCCSLQSTEEASKTARHLGIPHSIIDVRDKFMDRVVKPFVNAYVAGITPNPCVLCNRFIKFPSLMQESEKRDAEYIATGHYARVERNQEAEGRKQKADTDTFLLKKGTDPKKDQSYVLYVLTQKELKRLILPLGQYRKDEVRKIAGELKLPAAERSESQEICFIEDRNYSGFVQELSHVETKPGPIVNMGGKVIGKHEGIYGYTIGQRKGMGISSPEPLYVVKIDACNNTIYAGPHEAAKRREFFVDEINWIMSVTPSLQREGSEFRASVKVRSTMKDEPATIYIAESKEKRAFRVVFDEPQWAPAPGQSAVFYEGDVVLGGGVIKTRA